MADNFNINTTQDQSLEAGGMDPHNPGLTLWDAMNKNAMTQQDQAQLVQQAVERTKQAKLQTSEETEDEADGARQATKGLISKDQAITTLKAGLANSSIDDDQKAAVLKDAQDTWPDVVSSDGVHRMITALHEGRITKLGEGEPFAATGTEEGPDGSPFAKGTMLQDIVDTSGDHHYVQSAERASVQNHDDSQGSDNEKQWRELGKRMDRFTQGGRGQILMNTVVRAKQALSLILDSSSNPTPQVLGQIYADISSIMAGGAGTDVGLGVASYTNALSDLNNKLGYYTGHYNLVTAWTKKLTDHTGLEDILNHLKDTLVKLINVASTTIKAQVTAEKPAFQPLIESNPQRFEDMVNAHVGVTTSGLPGGMVSTTGAPGTNAPQSTGNPQADPLGIL